jgi:dTDP-D-glucose 4,6-dehydratase
VAFGFVFENATREKVKQVSVWFQCRVVFLKARHLDAHTYSGATAQIYNIGSREEQTIVSVARDVCELLNRDPETTTEHVSNRAFNNGRYFIDCWKLLALGWRQEKSWDVVLAEPSLVLE